MHKDNGRYELEQVVRHRHRHERERVELPLPLWANAGVGQNAVLLPVQAILRCLALPQDFIVLELRFVMERVQDEIQVAVKKPQCPCVYLFHVSDQEVDVEKADDSQEVKGHVNGDRFPDCSHLRELEHQTAQLLISASISQLVLFVELVSGTVVGISSPEELLQFVVIIVIFTCFFENHFSHIVI